MRNHGRIIFNGDGYSDEWKKEAESRGLLNLASTPDAVPHLADEKNIKLFSRHKVLSPTEIFSRVEIVLENYAKVLHIEALTLIDMMNRAVIPAITAYNDTLCCAVNSRRAVSNSLDTSVEEELIARLTAANTEIYKLTAELKNSVKAAEREADATKKARLYHDEVLKLMTDIRKYADSAEAVVSNDYWPYPSYGDLLFRV